MSSAWSTPPVLLMLTFVDILLLGCNLLVLWIVIKLYTEILKIGHIQNIGAKE
jgi:hypothetical protein